tara:strand:+ start:256 stop:465 length:210 start_codon:yes stop_codon:yes gene_type:complete
MNSLETRALNQALTALNTAHCSLTNFRRGPMNEASAEFSGAVGEQIIEARSWLYALLTQDDVSDEDYGR